MKKVLCLLLVAVMSIGLVACGGLSIDDMVGKYELTGMTEKGKKLSKDEINEAQKILNISLEIKDDSKAVMSAGGESHTYKVDVDKKIFVKGKEKDEFTFEDDVLTLKDKKDKIEFTFKKK